MYNKERGIQISGKIVIVFYQNLYQWWSWRELHPLPAEIHLLPSKTFQPRNCMVLFFSTGLFARLSAQKADEFVSAGWSISAAEP